jgi:hypothetical protein
MQSPLGAVVAGLLAAGFLQIGPVVAAAEERKRQPVTMSAAQERFIVTAFAAAVPEAGKPDITAYPRGAYVARAVGDRVQVHVNRSTTGEVTAHYTVSGAKAARGYATANPSGDGSSQTLFGPDGDRSAEFAASRLARSLAPAFP